MPRGKSKKIEKKLESGAEVGFAASAGFALQGSWAVRSGFSSRRRRFAGGSLPFGRQAGLTAFGLQTSHTPRPDLRSGSGCWALARAGCLRRAKRPRPPEASVGETCRFRGRRVCNPAVYRPCALRGLIFNQAPVAGRCSAQITSGGKGTSSGYRSRRSAPTSNVPVR